jgi:mRNA interferase MazF
MEGLVKGDIIVIPFPFSDLSSTKRRPALVIATLEGNDCILCQITSQFKKDPYAILLEEKDLETGTLKQTSNIRPNRLFTADQAIILYRIGHVKSDKMLHIIDSLIDILRHEETRSL